jgi:hypothetical protein
VHRSPYEVTLDFAVVDPGLDATTPVARIDLPLAAQRPTIDRLRAAHDDWQVAQAMTLPDATQGRLADDTWAFAGHRRVRDGARVALLVVPGLLRFDIHGRGDSFSFHVRNLGSEEFGAPIEETAPRAAPRRRGSPRTEHELRTRLASGAGVRIVVHVSPYTGALETDHSAVALVEPS